MSSYYQRNKERLKQKAKERYYSLKDGFWRVYLLEDYDYVGMTHLPLQIRFYEHNNLGRDTKNHRVLYKTKSKQKAKELESFLHELGYKGKHSHFSWINNMTKEEISLMRKKAALKMWETRK